jgi:hypothetical protein
MGVAANLVNLITFDSQLKACLRFIACVDYECCFSVNEGLFLP